MNLSKTLMDLARMEKKCKDHDWVKIAELNYDSTLWQCLICKKIEAD